MDALVADPTMKRLIDEHGEVDLVTEEDPFRRLAIAIVNQQLSTASAAAIRDRLVERVELRPESVLAMDDGQLREVGLSHQKVEYLNNVATYFEENDVSRDTLLELSNEEVVEALTGIKGVGVWTVKMLLISCLGREDVFPVEDLGIRRAMQNLYDIDEQDEMVDAAEQWRPYRSYAAKYLWLSVD